MQYSPKVTRVPPLAAPRRPGWCCLRCLPRRGISMGQLSSVAVAEAEPSVAELGPAPVPVGVGSAASLVLAGTSWSTGAVAGSLDAVPLAVVVSAGGPPPRAPPARAPPPRG